MKITLYIHDPAVVHWQLKEKHRTRLQHAMPGADIILVQHEADFLVNLPDSDVVLIWVFKDEWLAMAPKLRCIATPAAGRDHVPQELPDSITVIRGHFHGAIMAETALSMLLTLCRNTDGWVRAGNDQPWPQTEISTPMRTVTGSHILICGFGPIAQAIAKRLKTFDVRLSIIKRTPLEDKPRFLDPGDSVMTEKQADDRNVWATADFIISILPGGESTTNFISEHRINLLPRGAGIINLGRGNAIDEHALVNAVEAHHLCGAFLDVFKEEPLPIDSPLRESPAIRLMPHISAAAPEYLDYFIEEFLAVQSG